jgi:Spy/CpxP family protein refolding chaperone
MRRSGLVVTFIFMLAATPGTQSPYAGQQTREIKSLDATAVEALQKGEGNGMALVGELNHYPGPRHVLAMASQLDLTDTQKTATQNIYNKMHSSAIPLGLQIIEKERQLNLAFQNNAISDDSLRDLTSQIAMLNGELRDIHLSAHLAMKRVLTPKQIESYDSMRGYGDDMPGMQH